MAELKGVVFGWNNVLVASGSLQPQAAQLEETGRLVRFLANRGIEIVVVTNQHHFLKNRTTGVMTPAKDFFEAQWGVKIDAHLCGQNGNAGRQSQAGFQAILNRKGWEPNNVVIVGNSETDMQMAVVNKVLLLTAKWYPNTPETTDYGFHFPDAKGLARFIDVFCLRGHHWYYQINDGRIEVYTLAPLGNYFSESKYYSDDFKQNVKEELALDDEFWAKFLSTSMYFSGVYQKVDYITAYPKHEAGKWPKALEKPVDTFAKSFSKRYIPDLICRHTTSVRSHYNRATVDHINQLNTINICQRPTRIERSGVKQYKKFPIEAGKTVLVIDDVCTKGMSFEAARHYLNSLGINVISVALLKARKNDYETIERATLPFGAHGRNTVTDFKPGKVYGYNDHIVDTQTITELTQGLQRYQNWDWPG